VQLHRGHLQTKKTGEKTNHKSAKKIRKIVGGEQGNRETQHQPTRAKGSEPRAEGGHKNISFREEEGACGGSQKRAKSNFSSSRQTYHRVNKTEGTSTAPQWGATNLANQKEDEYNKPDLNTRTQVHS